MPGALPDRAEIADSQLTQLRALLGAVLPANSFYARKLSNASLGPAITSLAEFFKHCPFTTKAELVEDQKNHPPFGTNLTFPLDQYTRCHQTSGSTGAALRWLDTTESWESLKQNWEEVFGVAGVTRGDRIFFAFSFGPFLGFWLAFEAAQTKTQKKSGRRA